MLAHAGFRGVKHNLTTAYSTAASKTLEHIDQALETAQDTGHRAHLGASSLGGKCLREIWYKWRWARKELHTGRILRLFDRGHREEARFVGWLRAAGVEVAEIDPLTGKQFTISGARGHYGGSADAILLGVPDVPPGEYALGEFKTHKNSSYNALVKHGLHSSKPVHFAQMQQYMGKLHLNWGLYLAVNKDTDALYGEVVQLQRAAAQGYYTTAEALVNGVGPPARISPKPNFYYCKNFCHFRAICHEGATPDRNCRTCRYSEPADGGEWVCLRYSYTLSKGEQVAGCADYALPANHVADPDGTPANLTK